MDQLKRRIRLYKTAAAHDSDAATGDGAQRHHYYHFFPPPLPSSTNVHPTEAGERDTYARQALSCARFHSRDLPCNPA